MKKYTLGLYEKAMPNELSWKDKLAAAKQAGFDFIEISIDETDEKLSRLDMSQAERMLLLNTCLVMEMPIRSMCLSGHRRFPLGSTDPSIEAKGMEIMEKAIQLADDLGIRVIQLAGYDVYYEEGNKKTRERFARNLAEAVNMASARAIVMGFETMETEFMNTVGKAMEYVKGDNSPYLMVYPDIGNITNAAKTYKTDVMEDLKTGKGHIIAMHLKETIPGVFREVPFGAGHVDFQSAIKTAWELGVRKYVTEFWYTGSPEWKEELKAANRIMSAMLDAQSA
ncbi:MAG TPA: L-ribulose-5-phosphate 3-epimerase [Clostridiales bacterium]|nr:L-ribulose-5-phosphate 3-epimerase [Clostridiales bacterium]